MKYAIDVSNFQPSDLGPIIEITEAEHVIVRLFLPEEIPSQHISIAQLHSAKFHGCSTGGYFWLYNNLDPIKSVQDALSLFGSADVGKLPVLWHDIEPYNNTIPSVNEIRLATNYCIAQGVSPGLYIAKWVVDAYYPNGQLEEFGHLPHWLAYYDYDPDLDPQDLGYEYILAGQQYSDYPVDLNIMYKEYTEVKEQVARTNDQQNIINILNGWSGGNPDSNKNLTRIADWIDCGALHEQAENIRNAAAEVKLAKEALEREWPI